MFWQDGYTTSLTVNYTWKQGLQKAICYWHRHTDNEHQNLQVPVEDCGCGFYAMKEIPNPEDGVAMWKRNGICILIEALGKVVLHESGYRAEYVVPLAVIHPVLIKTIGQRPRKLLGVSVLSSEIYVGLTSTQTANDVSENLAIPICSREQATARLEENHRGIW